MATHPNEKVVSPRGSPLDYAKKYGIELPDDATPRDAWNALKGIGISPKDEYEKFFGDKDKDKTKDKDTKTPPKDADTITSRRDRIFSGEGDAKHFTYTSSFTEEYAKAQFDAGDDFHKEVLLKTLEDSRITYQHGKRDECFSAIGRVYLTVDPEYGGEDNSYAKGEVFYHESYHAVDGAYASFWGGMASHTYRDENCQSLFDVLKSEKRAFKSTKMQEVVDMHKKDIDTMIANDGTDVKAIDKAWAEAQQTKRNLMYGTPEYVAYINSEEFKQAYQNNLDLSRKRIKYEKKFNKKYGFISDIMSQYDMSIGMGHSMSYWRKDKYNSSSEFFAEVGACSATNKEALEMVKQYFPKSVAFAQKNYK